MSTPRESAAPDPDDSPHAETPGRGDRPPGAPASGDPAGEGEESATPPSAGGRQNGPVPPAAARPPDPLSADDDDQADLTADIVPALPTGTGRGLRLPGGSRRISVGELEGHHVQQGTHPGDRFVRRA